MLWSSEKKLLTMWKKIKKHFRKKLTAVNLFLFLLIIISSYLRFYNLDWDMGNLFHPDERNIANAVTKIKFFSQLNPEFFAYGGLSVYLYRLTGEFLSKITGDIQWVYSWGYINLIGRFYSAFFSTITIFPVYLLAKKLGGIKSAIIASTLFTFTVSSIQTAHYGVTESFITLIVISICAVTVNVKKWNFKNSFIIGVLLGLGTAAKTTSVSFIVIPTISFFSYFLYLKKYYLKFKYLLFIAAIAFVFFTLFSPFTFIDNVKFMESMRYEQGVVNGSLPVPYTLQFDKTIPYLFQLANLFWQMGPVFILAILGFIFCVFKALKVKDKKFFVFIIFPLLYFLYVGSWHTKFIRYMMPMIPFLVISASILLTEIPKKFKLIGNTLIIVSIFTTILYAFAFFSIYQKESTRISASRWIYKNIPQGSEILGEHWDDGLPVPVGLNNQSKFQVTALTIYEPDNFYKINYLSSSLAGGDYIIFNSRRLYGTLIHLEEKYPVTSNYYELLFAEKLGYRKIAEFTSYPALLGMEINDDMSEETFQVYEHPKVIIFKNTERLSQDVIAKKLNEATSR